MESHREKNERVGVEHKSSLMGSFSGARVSSLLQAIVIIVELTMACTGLMAPP